MCSSPSSRFAAVDPALRSEELPGYAIAGAYSGRTLAIVVGVGAGASVAGLIPNGSTSTCCGRR
jgi:hypothetical protein